MSIQESLKAAGSGALRALQDTEAYYARIATEVAELQRAGSEAQKRARIAAGDVLLSICADSGVPIEARAAWSAAYYSRTTPAGSSNFVDLAKYYSGCLAEIDGRLRGEERPPILGLRIGGPPDTGLQSVYRTGNGKGLGYTQYTDTDATGLYRYHVRAEEDPPHNGHRPNRFDGESDGPIISDISPGALVASVVTAKVAVETLRSAPYEPTTIFVIGTEAVRAMFEMARVSAPEAAALVLGRAVVYGDFLPLP